MRPTGDRPECPAPLAGGVRILGRWVAPCGVLKFGYYASAVTTTRLMILGVVRWLQPVHGYDVRRELLSWQVEDWASIAPGSIYHALRKLTDEGLLEEVATEQV